MPAVLRSGPTLAGVLVALLLAGCGFHLQGAVRTSPRLAAVYVDASDEFTEFHRAMLSSLRGSGVRVTTHRAEATAVLRITKDQSSQRVLSVSGSNSPTEYEVFYTVIYAVESGGTELIEPQTLSLTRDYSFDETALLAKEHEQEQIRTALARQLADLVMHRLAVL
jgi:LPS-assembly lipoprotein